jgi:hypothetical protein
MDGSANGKASDSRRQRIILRFPINGASIDRRTLNRFLDEIEAAFHELELQELDTLFAEVDKKHKNERQWEWAKAAAHHKLDKEYAGRRFQIVPIEGVGLAFEIAVTAAAFGVLKEALDYANITPRLDGTRRGFQNRAEHSLETTLVVCKDRFLRSNLFHVQLDDNQLILTAKLEEQDAPLPTMQAFVEAARKNASIWDILDLRARLTSFL